MSMPAGFCMAPLIRLPRDPAGCWEWLGKINTAGYPMKEHLGKSLIATRWMWQTVFGLIPAGLVVSATCGNRACVNPHHLRLQSQAEACRAGSGATLTPDDVRELRALVDNGVHRDTVAERYGVSLTTISDVMRRKSWKRKTAPGGRPGRITGQTAV